MRPAKLWMRHEVRPTEHRAPIAPADARTLVRHGIELAVEVSEQRCFALSDYLDAGCVARPAGSWVGASPEHHVIGLKELPEVPAALAQRHVFFGHAYRGQPGGRRLLERFAAGGGALLDLEYLTDEGGRRLAAFGYWAGYAGAALGVLALRGQLPTPLRVTSKAALDEALLRSRRADGAAAVVVGALGRCGRGAQAALELAGLRATCWDVEETRSPDRGVLLAHELLVHAVATPHPVPALLTAADLGARARRLAVICDITCDAGSDRHMLPIYDSTTDWHRPVLRLPGLAPALDVIAIDNLPSLLAREASAEFSAQLAPYLLELEGPAAAWRHCLRAFQEACAGAGLHAGDADG